MRTKQAKRGRDHRIGPQERQGGEAGLNVNEGLDPGYLNAGLMKPQRGFTLVAGKEKTGGAQDFDSH